jgi:hypothetical protein
MAKMAAGMSEQFNTDYKSMRNHSPLALVMVESWASTVLSNTKGNNMSITTSFPDLIAIYLGCMNLKKYEFPNKELGGSFAV